MRGYYRGDPRDLYEAALQYAQEYVEERPPGKEPGAAMVEYTDAWRVPRLRSLYTRALRDHVPRGDAEDALRASGALYSGGSGLVGAAAVLAANAPWDPVTYELIAYRSLDRLGEPRCVTGDPRAESVLPPCTWANYDLYTGRPVMAPGGPDPVLAGFRGSMPWCLARAGRLLCEETSLWALYATNQHTGLHTRRHPHSPPRPYQSLRIRAVVASQPRELAGGHVVVTVEHAWGRLDAAFYRETGPLRDAARLLRPGDHVVLEGVVVPRSIGPTLAVEALTVSRLSRETLRLAPRCPRCGHRMTSMGRGKGYKCPRCGHRDPGARPLLLELPRRLLPGRYTSTVSGARHLTMFEWWPPASGGPPRGVYSVECFVVPGPEPPAFSRSPESCKPVV